MIGRRAKNADKKSNFIGGCVRGWCVRLAVCLNAFRWLLVAGCWLLAAADRDGRLNGETLIPKIRLAAGPPPRPLTLLILPCSQPFTPPPHLRTRSPPSPLSPPLQTPGVCRLLFLRQRTPTFRPTGSVQGFSSSDPTNSSPSSKYLLVALSTPAESDLTALESRRPIEELVGQ
ncbi:uncharacterized protein LY89DRAFT_49936 [Mollisia scopiformis]|uniref:Uncharacterized protein n=1 Tax=Mollisia scopiformis TaxID=149040 RepID=A0A194XBY7_MOLSC|nr:uncharacterized protein LY89DRAFT_49936 [Mollisia scopiformis]KUJ17267.1 hypothetical protein LY89DRAFT_49936 [Mollisia scopiformis]